MGSTFTLTLTFDDGAPTGKLSQADDPSPDSPAVKGMIYFHAAGPLVQEFDT